MENLTIHIISDAYIVPESDLFWMAKAGDKEAMKALSGGPRMVLRPNRRNMAKIVFERQVRSGQSWGKERHTLSGLASTMPDRASFQTDSEFIEATIATGLFTHERETVSLGY